MADTETGITGPLPKALDVVAKSMLVEPTEKNPGPRNKIKKKDVPGWQPKAVRVVEEGSGDEPVTARESDDSPEPEAVSRKSERDQSDELVEKDTPEDLEVSDSETDPDAFEEGEEAPFDEWADYGDAPQRAEDGPDDESDDGQVRPLELADDTQVSVTVDGESQVATIAELKKRYAGEGAIEKRLQEATELRKVAVQQVAHNRDKLAEVLNAVGGFLFTPTTAAPDPALARSNPGAFLEQQTLHQNEVTMLNDRKQKLNQALVASDAEVQQANANIRQEEAAKLRVALPVLSHPVRGPKVQAAILSAAKDIYGFSDIDIAAATDHRIFVMAADAMRYRKMVERTKASPMRNRPRTIRPSGGGNRTLQSGEVKREKSAFKKARASGNAEDVAATMIVKKPRSKRHRR